MIEPAPPGALFVFGQESIRARRCRGAPVTAPLAPMMRIHEWRVLVRPRRVVSLGDL
jgi:hypothetical protein